MKYLIPLFLIPAVACDFVVGSSSTSETQTNVIAENTTTTDMQETQSFYDFTVNTLEGESFSFEQLKGKRVLIVNTASECGYTPQYEQLQELYAQYGGDDFVIVGFPANNFGGQEPGSNEEIATFCQRNYGVTFPMMEKISVKGDDMHPVYHWLTEAELNGVADGDVRWNFHKFTVDENGKLVGEYGSSVSPLGDEILNFAKGE